LAAEYSPPPIVVFSKVYQTLHLDFEAAAAVTAEAGLNGVDCPLRPGGEILPERVSEDLPRYVEVLRRKNLHLPLLTTAIINVSSPHTEGILRLAKKLGIQFYRLGFIDQKKDVPVKKQLSEIKAQLKDLAALNQQIGITALVQNHSPSGHTYIAGDLSQLEELVSDFDPAQIGAAFDIGHALIVHGDDWRGHFEKLKSHLKIAYVKDAKRDGRWVPFGQGDIGATGYFKLLKAMGYHAPISLHIEFDWSNMGKNETRAALVTALTESTQVLKRWLAEA
jgi:sugar phosphate isomerase/epimerase